MTFQEITDIIRTELGAQFAPDEKQELQPQLIVPAEYIAKVCRLLHTHPDLYFDFLSSITGTDNGPEKGTFEIIYHLYSIPFNHSLTLKVILPRDTEKTQPEIDSISEIYRGANWQEREIYDMYGISFTGHPDLRRILLPEDWQGYPLRKDYKTQKYYHGISVENEENK